MKAELWAKEKRRVLPGEGGRKISYDKKEAWEEKKSGTKMGTKNPNTQGKNGFSMECEPIKKIIYVSQSGRNPSNEV